MQFFLFHCSDAIEKNVVMKLRIPMLKNTPTDHAEMQNFVLDLI